MKATRRHELKENDLSQMLVAARDYLTEHGTKVGMIIFVLVVVLAVIGISVRTRGANIERDWMRMSQLTFDDPTEGKASIEKLRAMLVDAPDDNFVLSSLITLGSQSLRLAQEVPVPPDMELNQQARGAFEELLRRFGANPLAFGLAHCGLATVEENEFAVDSLPGHKERAEAHLQAIIENPALNSLPFHRVASDRLADLDKVFTVVRFADPEIPEAVEEDVEPEGPPAPFVAPVEVEEFDPIDDTPDTD